MQFVISDCFVKVARHAIHESVYKNLASRINVVEAGQH